MIKYEIFTKYIDDNIQSIDLIKAQYLNLLSYLTVVNEITNEQFMTNINLIHKIGIIYIAYNEMDIIATGTILIEPKIIRNAMNVGHIEDIVVLPEYRNIGISSHILGLLKNYGFSNNCYKIILDVNDKYKQVYEKNNFRYTGIQMSIKYDEV